MRFAIPLLGVLCLCACTHSAVIPDDTLNDRFPAGLPGAPMRLVCAGPASADWVFGFFGLPGKMTIQFSGSGSEEPIVSGVANITLRTRGSQAQFERPMALRGSRSADGREYHLAGVFENQNLEMDLIYNGTGTLTRTWIDGSHAPEKYLSVCQENNGRAAL